MRGDGSLRQQNLFDVFDRLPEGADKTDFYRHEQNWSNRMILGDSLQVMASLAEQVKAFRDTWRDGIHSYLTYPTGSDRATTPTASPAGFATDYDEQSFLVRHAYFLGAGDPYAAIKTTLKAEIDPESWESLRSDTSRPFARPAGGRSRSR